MSSQLALLHEVHRFNSTINGDIIDTYINILIMKVHAMASLEESFVPSVVIYS